MLNESLRKQYMEALGYSYDKKGILEMQSDYFTRKVDRDGIYGNNTDILLRNLYNFKLSGIVKNFNLHEFKCGCGAKYCTGYPAVVSQAQLKMVQAIRTHYGKPMTVTCGLRCKGYNKALNGSIANSSHMTGYATDYYIKGVTDTLANRKTSIKWIKKQDNHAYTYGNGINSNGVKINAPYMGNALHTDTKTSVKDAYPSIKPSTPNADKIIDTCDKPVNVPKTYEGPFPDIHIKKSTAEVIADTLAWSKIIANDNSFHYGRSTEANKKAANHNGCYFCGTQPKVKKNSDIKGWEKTYCCNPFTHAAFAHGGCVPAMLKICQSGKSYGFSAGSGYAKSSLFKQCKPKKISDMAVGTVMCNNHHVAQYGGNSEYVEASGYPLGKDDNVVGSKKWNNSIGWKKLPEKRFKTFLRFYTFIGSVDTDMSIRFGEYSKRVGYMQDFLNWYGGYGLKVDKFFGDSTLKALKDYQTKRCLTVDGVAGKKTLADFKIATK